MWILDVGWVNLAGDHEALGVGDDVALAALDPLAGIHPTRTATFRGRCALAVDDTGRWCKGAVQRLTGSSHQLGIDPIPGSVIATTIEVSLHRRARWEVPRQRAPLTPSGENIKDRIEYLAVIPNPRPPQPPSWRQVLRPRSTGRGSRPRRRAAPRELDAADISVAGVERRIEPGHIRARAHLEAADLLVATPAH